MFEHKIYVNGERFKPREITLCHDFHNYIGMSNVLYHKFAADMLCTLS